MYEGICSLPGEPPAQKLGLSVSRGSAVPGWVSELRLATPTFLPQTFALVRGLGSGGWRGS